MGERTHKGSLRVAAQPARRGLKPAQTSPLTEKAIFRLDARSDFWEARSCQASRFPQASPQRLACVVSGVWFPSRTDDRTRLRIIRRLRESPSKLCSVQVSSR